MFFFWVSKWTMCMEPFSSVQKYYVEINLCPCCWTLDCQRKCYFFNAVLRLGWGSLFMKSGSIDASFGQWQVRKSNFSGFLPIYINVSLKTPLVCRKEYVEWKGRFGWWERNDLECSVYCLVWFETIMEKLVLIKVKKKKNIFSSSPFMQLKLDLL